MAIYTKKGDKGQTRVFDKKSGELVPVSKTSCQIVAIGSIDELNSYLGIVKSGFTDKSNINIVEKIQRNLFVINSILAGAKLRFLKISVKNLEKRIDDWEGTLPVLKNFIIYGGGSRASQIFYARALCRRAERSLVEFIKEEPLKNENILKYLNRLSDFLFMFARYVSNKEGIKEDYWKISK